jgi:hypothetical protein
MAGLGPLAVLLATLATPSLNGTRSAIRLGDCAGETVNMARPLLQQVSDGQVAVCALCVYVICLCACSYAYKRVRVRIGFAIAFGKTTAATAYRLP